MESSQKREFLTVVDDTSDSDGKMVSTRSNVNLSAQAFKQGDVKIGGHPQVNEAYEDQKPTEEDSMHSPSLDLLDQMRRTYRLLDLVSDNATGGSVDKVVIAQESIEKFANQVEPGSYASITKVNFRALDKHTIKPRGIYGSIKAIVQLFEELGCVDQETASLLLTPRDQSSGVTRPALRPGIYLVDVRDIHPGLCYVVFWPEDSTWQDGVISAVSRNRITFMRYLTKLCDQVVCLIDDEHSSKLVWHEEETNHEDLDNSLDDDIESRLQTFSVEETQNQAESATAREGFSFRHACIDGPKVLPNNCSKDISWELLHPRLVVGDLSQGILTTSYLSDDTVSEPYSVAHWPPAIKDILEKGTGMQVRLDDSLDVSSTEILHELGLSGRCGGADARYEAQIKEDEARRETDRTQLQEQTQQDIKQQMEGFSTTLPIWLIQQVVPYFPTLSKEALILNVSPSSEGISDSEQFTKAISDVEDLFARYPDLERAVTFKLRDAFKRLEQGSRSRYNTLKRQYCQINAMLDSNKDISVEMTQRLVDLIVLEETFEQDFNDILDQLKPEEQTGLLNLAFGWFTGSSSQSTSTIKPPVKKHNILHDIAFWKKLQADNKAHPGYNEAEKEIRTHVMQLVANILRTRTEDALKHIETALAQRLPEQLEQVDCIIEDRRKKEEKVALISLFRDMQEYLEKEFDNTRPCIKLSRVIRDGYAMARSYPFYDKPFRLIGTQVRPKQVDIEYKLHLFETTADDQQQLSINPGHICKPFINDRRTQTFGLLSGSKLRQLYLIGKDSCLVIIEAAGNLNIYFESIDMITRAIHNHTPKKHFDLERVGEDCLTAIDESKRLLAVLSSIGKTVQIYVYVFDENSKSLFGRGGAVNISRWYPGGIPKFERFLFVPGNEELLLVDNKSASRIFSLNTETFRSRTIQLKCVPHAIFPTSDGSCLIVLDEHNKAARLRCFHWSSFGEHGGINIPLPPWVSPTTQMAVSSIGHRDNVQVIFLLPETNSCTSLSLTITRKSNAFAFRHSFNERSDRKRTTIHNSLIDCYSEVWTRFPIRAPIRHERSAEATLHPPAVLFVSGLWSGTFSSYFQSMVFDFESKTRKPSDGLLRQIQITSTQSWNPTENNEQLSEICIGDWLVGMLCLIPIHLAVTAANRFNPLKDGVSSAEFDYSLLGANVTQISQALSFGWYESIFSSYLADKPVKVVTSMGEQSVGKSYALNHFVDTSFAGSAMRCTEGVWLSVTPTRDFLIVAMDFEGVQSIERSAQEDTLLVLLNTAVSNFVLFRNNFAISRDIAGLFSSFQSCISVLDPASNPTLFQSRLEIIIKDVIASDTKEMTKEFYLKFERLVQDEGGDNFITKLHRGKLDIISWPVIESSGFYKLFNSLKTNFMKQSVTHPHAGAFLIMLKTLMAKLKANDWGALDQNLAIQRAQYLSGLLIPALCFGKSDLITNEPLKNYDTDQVIISTDEANVLYLPFVIHPATNEALTVDGCLKELRKSWGDRLKRYSMDEGAYIASYRAYLDSVATSRITVVHDWLRVNTSRFSENAETKALFRTFEEYVKEIKAAIIPCGATCSSCNLKCLHQRHHKGDHDCTTTHKCSKCCAFIDQHGKGDTIPPCDMPAGHEGRHVCKMVAHLCGMVCQLDNKDGCLRKCAKALDHKGDGHMCAATVHACGAPCDLTAIMDSNGLPVCTRKCVVDSRKPHAQHCCEHSFACPIKCSLCKSYCAAGDHFHGLEPGAKHLCGQLHLCSHECELPGICKVDNKPQSIESTFVGRYDSFQYTKYTQEARRLPCGIPIQPDELEHSGEHVHSTDPNIFHFCEARCQLCGYYCDRPLNHDQDEHHTLHGSMEKSKWVLEGNDDATLNLKGRRYASGDSGAPVLCSMICKELGRHVHISSCRADSASECQEEEVEHIKGRDANSKQDWISHRLFWARSGFEDPYTHAERAEFALCDRKCGGEEHDPSINQGAKPSYCTLPLFHPPASPADAPGTGHISHDGHIYTCKDPALMQKSFHVFFALDRSGSMTLDDRRPLPDTPATERIAEYADNRFGAVLSSVYGFWLARDAATRSGANAGVRRDAYTIVVFDHNASVACSNDVDSTPDSLLGKVPEEANWHGGTNFTVALETIREQMEESWVADRYPVVIFLSDGECNVNDETVYKLCRMASSLGKPLALHTISFGNEAYSSVLKRMATIAKEVYETAPVDESLHIGPTPCNYHTALDTVQLADTFINIAASLRNPRAALINA